MPKEVVENDNLYRDWRSQNLGGPEIFHQELKDDDL
jgi:hypothetical protein